MYRNRRLSIIVFYIETVAQLLAACPWTCHSLRPMKEMMLRVPAGFNCHLIHLYKKSFGLSVVLFKKNYFVSNLHKSFSQINIRLKPAALTSPFCLSNNSRGNYKFSPNLPLALSKLMTAHWGYILQAIADCINTTSCHCVILDSQTDKPEKHALRHSCCSHCVILPLTLPAHACHMAKECPVVCLTSYLCEQTSACVTLSEVTNRAKKS